MSHFNHESQLKDLGLTKDPMVTDPMRTQSPMMARTTAKTERDEAFPVAAFLARKHRPVVSMVYGIVRAADDLADSPSLSPEEKHRALADLWTRERPRLPETLQPHVATLIEAFHRDIDTPECTDWPQVQASAHASAAPVGRLLLTLHREPDSNGPATDALCQVLQLLNHIGDVEQDRQRLGRSYLPRRWLDDANGDVPAVLERMLDALLPLFAQAHELPRTIRSHRLAFQAAVTVCCARRFYRLLRQRHDWRSPPRFGRSDMGLAIVGGVALFLQGRFRRYFYSVAVESSC